MAGHRWSGGTPHGQRGATKARGGRLTPQRGSQLEEAAHEHEQQERRLSDLARDAAQATGRSQTSVVDEALERDVRKVTVDTDQQRRHELADDILAAFHQTLSGPRPRTPGRYRGPVRRRNRSPPLIDDPRFTLWPRLVHPGEATFFTGRKRLSLGLVRRG